jgi:general secretion pathway protein B
MSYILDALKKLEHEKIKKTRGTGMSNITGELFSSVEQRGDAGGSGKIILITIIVALVTFGVTWFFLKPVTSGKTKTARPVPGVPTPAATQPPSVPPTSIPTQPHPDTAISSGEPTSPVLQAKPLPHPVPVIPVPTPVQTSRVTKPQTVAAKPPAQSAEEAAALITVQELKKRMKEQKTNSAPTMAPPPDIKLSGIAWQDDRRARRAVINGFLLQEGGIVSGAKITEILQDRVRFSLSGSVFEISLTASSGMPPAGR